MQSVCPCCKAKYAFIQISGIDLGEALTGILERMRSKKNMSLKKEMN